MRVLLFWRILCELPRHRYSKTAASVIVFLLSCLECWENCWRLSFFTFLSLACLENCRRIVEVYTHTWFLSTFERGHQASTPPLVHAVSCQTSGPEANTVVELSEDTKPKRRKGASTKRVVKCLHEKITALANTGRHT